LSYGHKAAEDPVVLAASQPKVQCRGRTDGHAAG
jgi:hypothetical protein